ncbi:MAG: hypothetical protein QGI86_04215 [Candidatus Poribacteria bacterium]|nr:hypothetical protein [Candidatus Poribacteria bacterium]MDP6745724.1 hypothetical protein [Candidatus Poribacteria bacterium]
MTAYGGRTGTNARSTHPGLPNARWVAVRLLDRDDQVRQSLESDELVRLAQSVSSVENPQMPLETVSLEVTR